MYKSSKDSHAEAAGRHPPSHFPDAILRRVQASWITNAHATFVARTHTHTPGARARTAHVRTHTPTTRGIGITHTRTSAHTRRPPMVLVYTHTRTSAHTRRPPTYPHMSAHIHAQHDYTDWNCEPSGKRSVSWPVPVIEPASSRGREGERERGGEKGRREGEGECAPCSASWPVPVIEAASRAADAMDQFVPRNLRANQEAM